MLLIFNLVILIVGESDVMINNEKSGISDVMLLKCMVIIHWFDRGATVATGPVKPLGKPDLLTASTNANEIIQNFKSLPTKSQIFDDLVSLFIITG